MRSGDLIAGNATKEFIWTHQEESLFLEAARTHQPQRTGPRGGIGAPHNKRRPGRLDQGQTSRIGCWKVTGWRKRWHTATWAARLRSLSLPHMSWLILNAGLK